MLSETVEPNAAGNAADRLESRFAYDLRGNRITATVLFDDRGSQQSRTSSNLFDPEGRFNIRTTNALGQTASAQYDPSWGTALKLTDSNGLVAITKIDAFGRTTASETRDSANQLITKTAQSLQPVSALAAGVAPQVFEHELYFTQTKTHTGALGYTLYDRLGRARRNLSQSFGNASEAPSATAYGGPFVETYSEYDRLGRAVKTFKYYGDKLAFSQMRYDALGQLIATIAPDGTRTQQFKLAMSEPDAPATAAKRFVTIGSIANTLPDGRVEVQSSRKFVNSQGWTLRTDQRIEGDATLNDPLTLNSAVSVTRSANGAAERYLSTQFSYDALGHVNKLSAPGGNPTAARHIVETQYDLRGRKTKLIDPDAGTIGYAYNGAGELIAQTDARGYVSETYYDLLGRSTLSVAWPGVPDSASASNPAFVTRRSYDCANAMGKLCKEESGYFTNSTGASSTATPSVELLTQALAQSSQSQTQYDLQSRPTVQRQTLWATSSAASSATTSATTPATATAIAETFDSYTLYDSAGRIGFIGYPQAGNRRLGLHHQYDARGFAIAITDSNSGADRPYNPLAYASPTTTPPTQPKRYWALQSRLRDGQIAQSERGGVMVTRGFNRSAEEGGGTDLLGRLRSIDTQNAQGQIIQALRYRYDSVGNVRQRADSAQARQEYFNFDLINRLIAATGPYGNLTGGAAANTISNTSTNTSTANATTNTISPNLITKTYRYDDSGNLLYKSDIGAQTPVNLSSPFAPGATLYQSQALSGAPSGCEQAAAGNNYVYQNNSHRLICAAGKRFNAYDANGNVLSLTHTAQALTVQGSAGSAYLGQTSTTTSTTTSTANGSASNTDSSSLSNNLSNNLTLPTSAAQSTTTFSYGVFNLPTQIVRQTEPMSLADGSAQPAITVTANYRYGAGGRLRLLEQTNASAQQLANLKQSPITETLYIGGGLFERQRLAQRLSDIEINADGSAMTATNSATYSVANTTTPASAALLETHWRHYITTPEGIIGVVTITQDDKTVLLRANPSLPAAQIAAIVNDANTALLLAQRSKIWFKDHLGSLTAETEEGGALSNNLTGDNSTTLAGTASTASTTTSVQLFAYDPWGARLNLNGAQAGSNGVNPESATDRGFTGHEHLFNVGLIHMNGRLYDPETARFLQPDPLVANAHDSQSYNRYSYVLNNPLAYTDPTGYRYEPSGWDQFIDNTIMPMMTAVAAIGVCGPGAPLCMMAFNIGGAALNVLAQGGGESHAIGAMINAGASALLFTAAGDIANSLAQVNLVGPLPANEQALRTAFGSSGFAIGRATLHALAGCIGNAVAGQSCGSGAAGAFVGKLAQLSFADSSFANSEFGRMPEGGFIIAATAGCAGGFAGGGGAMGCGGGAAMAAAGYLFNALGECAATGMCGSDGAYGRPQYVINLTETGHGTGIFSTTVIDLGGVQYEVGATTLRTDHPRCATRGGCPEVADGAHPFKMETKTGNVFIAKFVPLPRLVDDVTMNGPNQLYNGKYIARGIWLHPWASPSSSNPAGRTGSEGCITCSLQTIRNIQAIIPVGAYGTLNIRRFSK